MAWYGNITLPLFPSPPFPAIQGVCNSFSTGNFLGDFLGLSFLALLVSSLYVLFFYLWGKLTDNPNIDVWMKGELYEIGATAFIVIFFLPLFLHVACAFKLGDLNIFETAHVYLDSLKASMTIVMYALGIGYMLIDLMASISLRAHPFGLGLSSVDVGAGIVALWRPIILQTTNMLTLGYIFASAQTVILEYFTYGMITKILPLGVLLRSFTPTRRIGGTLIGLSIGLLFLYPFILTLNYFLVEDYLVVSWDQGSKMWKISEGFKTVWEEMKKMLSLDPKDIISWGLIVGGLLTFLGFVFGAGVGITLLIFSLIILLLPVIVWGASLGVVAGVILPALNVVILVQGIRYFTYLFGEELDVTTLTRMV